MDLPERRRRAEGSRSKPGEEVEESGGESPLVGQRGRRTVWEGKFLIRSLQKQGVVDGWTPEPAGLVACESFRASDSTLKRTNGQGSIAIVSVLVLVRRRSCSSSFVFSLLLGREKSETPKCREQVDSLDIYPWKHPSLRTKWMSAFSTVKF